MADWGKAVESFQRGAEFAQDFRARRQIERARDQALESGEYDMQARRATRRARDPMSSMVLGELDPSSVQDYEGLEDPFAFKLWNWAKTKFRRKQRALDTGEGMQAPGAAPVRAPDESATSYALEDAPMMGEAPMPPEYADGGGVESEDEAAKRRARENRERRPGRVERATETVEGADRSQSAPRRSAIDTARAVDKKAGDFINVRPKEGMGRIRSGMRAIKGAGALGALASTAADTAGTDTEDYRKRFGLETDDPSLLGDIGVRALGAASDLGNALTLGAAGNFYRDKQEAAGPAPEAAPLSVEPEEQLPELDEAGSGSALPSGGRTALSQARPREQKYVNFADLDTDTNAVPNMQLDDWKKYRARLVDAARQSGRVESIKQANDMVTQMQMEGFSAYGQQGLALMSAGNVRGAMNAFRAAFQYFPNGNDVEFGTHRDPKTGRMQIVGFGKDERTGKVLAGSEIVMDPQRVAVLLENFKNPQAWRMWTKDWRDFEMEERKYEEVTKPLAQAQADYMASNAESNALRAENAALRGAGAGGAGAAANMRNAERVFRERLSMIGMEDETQADFLASVMSQVKAKNPQVPDNTIVQVIMASVQDGTLEQRLQKMGIGGGNPAAASSAPAAPRMAIDPAAWESPEMEGLSDEEKRWALTPAQ